MIGEHSLHRLNQVWCCAPDGKWARVQAARILDTGFERPGDIQQSSITFRRWLDGIPDANPFCRAIRQATARTSIPFHRLIFRYLCYSRCCAAL